MSLTKYFTDSNSIGIIVRLFVMMTFAYLSSERNDDKYTLQQQFLLDYFRGGGTLDKTSLQGRVE